MRRLSMRTHTQQYEDMRSTSAVMHQQITRHMQRRFFFLAELLHEQRQYLYFCTSKASKLRTCMSRFISGYASP
jgi:hypothetical protein